MIETMRSDKLEYKKLSPEEMKQRGILGRLVGVCADTINATRNGRKYSEELWEKVFKSPLVVEQFQMGGIFGELTHPDRSEVALEKVAIVMPEPPKKNSKGQLVGLFDILDTPSGKILKTLCDYGYTVGISTRGEGDIITDMNGDESVDPDTYTLNALDIVTIPAVKAARLQYVNESVEKKGVSLHESLQRLLKESSTDDRAIIEQELKELGLEHEELDPDADKNLTDEEEEKREILTEKELDEEFTYEVNGKEVSKNYLLNRVFDGDEKAMQEIEDSAILDDDASDEITNENDKEFKVDVNYQQSDVFSNENIKTVIREIIVKKADEYGFTYDIKFQKSNSCRIRITDFNSIKNISQIINKIINEVKDRLNIELVAIKRGNEYLLKYADIEISRHKNAGNAYAEVMYNGQIKSNNTSGTTGVSQEKSGIWRAYITIEKKRMTVGRYVLEKDAVKARKKAEMIAKDNSITMDEKIKQVKLLGEGFKDKYKTKQQEIFEDLQDVSDYEAMKERESDSIDVLEKDQSAEINGEGLIQELQEALIQNQRLQNSVKELQEKLSVCYTKETENENLIAGYKKSILNLTESAKRIQPLVQRVSVLDEELNSYKTKYTELNSTYEALKTSKTAVKAQKENLNEQLNTKDSKISQLTEKLQQFSNDYDLMEKRYKSIQESKDNKINYLNESVDKLNSVVESLRNKNNMLNEQLNESQNIIRQKENAFNNKLNNLKDKLKEAYEDMDQQKYSFEESIADYKKDTSIMAKKYEAQIKECNKKINEYKSIVESTIDRYAENQAVKYGLSSDYVKKQLTENCTFEDVDRICKKASDFRISINKLPMVEGINRVNIVEGNENSIVDHVHSKDDILDNDLLNFIK